ncbi:MAG: prenyltransferase [Nitrosopumilus sp.]|jgi:1,4-dihydroxy-2-naphthoate octaprenyltransferase|nr:prenyltransferase [Nitrosopumilus sp.]MBT3686351.1 prenyltransferase [Nitrosopumilus sp.]MBT3924837.1 prenyltransferase [Nitrosopumilus sp.]MBT4215909.1 prenyltransferase [Nitrosopumilus sp.]MBT4550340.1 prenyltransferase [Nitrosopumilus sp.]
MISVWLRVIRVRFLLASIIAVSVGLALHWSQNGSVDILDLVLTFAGVMALHASVDLLNDYWDFKRGIDTKTTRTKMSGGTGVLPEGLLKPSSVYRAGVAFLIIGSLIGSYFVMTHGILIAIILGFAILSIYFYSTKIVDSGLGEFFVAVKGSMIVIGTFFIQSGEVNVESILAGIVVGTLSSLVLFIASFPDHDADKSKGRKTLVIVVGKKKAINLFWIFPLISYVAIIIGVSTSLFPVLSLITLLSFPLIIKSGLGLRKNYDAVDELVPFMSSTLKFSRITGVLFALSFLFSLQTDINLPLF